MFYKKSGLKHSFRKILKALQNQLFLSFAFLMPISQYLSTINIVLLLLVSLINIKRGCLYFNIKYLPLIVLYILYGLSLFYSEELQLNIFEFKASLFIFPILFYINKDIYKHINSILKYFVFGCIIALIICEFEAVYNAIDFKNLIFDSRIDKGFSFYDSVLKEKNFFFSFNFSSEHQVVYFSMYLLFAITAILNGQIFKNRYLKYGIIFFLALGVLQLLNKASYFILFLLVAIKVLNNVKNKKTIIIRTIGLLAFFPVLLIINPRFKSFYAKKLKIDETQIIEKDFKKIKNLKANDTSFRIMLWASAIELIKENPIIGIGAGNSDKRLYEVFAVKRQWFDKFEKYHAHNQYLQVLLDIGILGFIIFLALFYFLISELNRLKTKADIAIITSFVILISINFLFESMLERYSGISFFCFFYCLILSNKVNIINSKRVIGMDNFIKGYKKHSSLNS